MIDTVIKGDCLDVLASLESNMADLAYLDPPFFCASMRTTALVSRTTSMERAAVAVSNAGLYLHEALAEEIATTLGE